MEIRTIKPSIIRPIIIKRVAVYARVSVSKDENDTHSVYAQTGYYESLIATNPDWELFKVYADIGISGTRDDRPAFQQMLQDAREHKYDLLITKSITRFARNVVTILKATRELKELGIDVVFEKEGIHTISPDGELLLTLLAIYAEEEAKSASQNVSWAIRKGFANGKHPLWRIYGYLTGENSYEVVPEEAIIIKRIYREFLKGATYHAIAVKLNKAGITRRGYKWTSKAIKSVLTNEKYTGNILLQKTHTTNDIKRKPVKNTGELKQYYIKNSHPSIVSVRQYKRVQAEIKRREENRPEYPTHNPEADLFRQKLICGQCGKYLTLHYDKSGDKRVPVYACKNNQEIRVERCRIHQLKKSILAEKTCETLGIDENQLTRELIDERIARIVNEEDYKLTYYFTNGGSRTVKWRPQYGWTEERRRQASERAKKQWTEEHRQAMSEIHKAGWTDKKRKQWSKRQKALWTDERRQKTSAERRAYWTPERKRLESELTKERIRKKKDMWKP